MRVVVRRVHTPLVLGARVGMVLDAIGYGIPHAKNKTKIKVKCKIKIKCKIENKRNACHRWGYEGDERSRLES